MHLKYSDLMIIHKVVIKHITCTIKSGWSVVTSSRGGSAQTRYVPSRCFQWWCPFLSGNGIEVQGSNPLKDQKGKKKRKKNDAALFRRYKPGKGEV